MHRKDIKAQFPGQQVESPWPDASSRIRCDDQPVRLDDLPRLSRLVGREQVMTRLLRMMNRPALRAGVLLAGPSGVGKTRLCEEAAVALSNSGFQIVRVIAALSPEGKYHAYWEQVAAWNSKYNQTRPGIPLLDALKQLTTQGAASRRNVILYIDDAHLLNDAAASTLTELARYHHVRFLLAINTDEPNSAALVNLWKDEHLHRLEVGALELSTARHLASAIMADRLAPSAATYLAQLSDGNPLLLRELANAACNQNLFRDSPSGLILSDAPSLSIPIIELISQKLSKLDSDAKIALEQIVLAEPVSLHLAERVMLPETLLRLENESLIYVKSTGAPNGKRETVEAKHPLIPYVIRQSLPVLRRRSHFRSWVSAHKKAARAFGADVATVTSWKLEAGLEVCCDELLAAAKATAATQDLQRCLSFASSAWHLYPSLQTASAYALSLVSVADFAQADSVIEKAAENFADQKGELAPVRVRNLLLQGKLDEAKVVISELSGMCRQLYLGMEHYFRGEISKGLAALTPIMESPESAEWLEAAIFYMACLLHAGRPEDALSIYRQASQSDSMEAYHADSLAQMHAVVLSDLGDIRQAISEITATHRTAVSKRSTRIEAQRALGLGSLLLEQGKPREAHSLLAFHSAYRVGWRLWDERAAVLSAIAEAAMGRISDAPLPDEKSSHFLIFNRIARAWMAYLSGDRDSVATLLIDSAEAATGNGAFAQVAIAVHEMGRMGIPSLGRRYWDAPVQGRYLQAKMDYTRSLATGDIRLLRKSAEIFVHGGFDLFGAEAYAELASLYQRDDQDRAATASALKARELADRCIGASTPALWQLGAAKPLTGRERELVALVAQGFTDKQIAERLTISVRTVNNHLYRIYRKLGVANRHALRIRFAAR
ncbi:LuxR C-terminal-related transcriptional regulator [Streptomyces sp900105245]|uniref:LuxR C-terminal-related transcriptional regulator n=1 Tax=Streptomyces sp. 900105245 TaxID=3154379 RepID=A0ABV1UL91_9ACTN